MERALRLPCACNMRGKKQKQTDGMGYCRERDRGMWGRRCAPFEGRAAGGEGSRNKVCNVVPYMFFSTASLVALLFVALPCLRVIMTAEMFTNLVRQFVQRYWYFRLS